MSKNKRIYYAIQQVGIKEDGDTGAFTEGDELHGVQSVGMSANFNLEQVFELGQQELYANDEVGLPDVEVTMQKALDGYPLIFHQATKGTSTSPDLVGRSTAKCIFGMSVFSDVQRAAEGTPGSVVQSSGMQPNSSSFTFSTEGFFTEDITLVGNDRVWANPPTHGETLNPNLPTPVFQGQFSSTVGDAPIGLGGVNRRDNFLFDYSGSTLDINGMVADPDATILPPDVFGISNSGTNDKDEEGQFGAHIGSITASVDLGREDIDELGRRGPYARTVTFPVEVTCEVELTSHSGDLVSLTEEGIYTTGVGCGSNRGNLLNRTIRIATCEGTRIYLGNKNKLASINYGGGDAGGGNVNVTYSYSTFNDYTVLHPEDPHASGATWWTNRADYLVTPSG